MTTDLLSAPFRRLLAPFAAIVLLACAAAPAVHAQNIFGAGRTSDLSTFILTSSVTPDYFPGSASGLTAGADWTRHWNRNIATAFEVRGSRSSNDMLIERSITFGPRVQTNLGSRYHPYVDFLIGGGTIVFLNHTTNYHEDRSAVTSMGGGMDIDFPHNLSARIDFQNQGWNIGKVTSSADTTFSPNLLSIGVQYHVPFRPRMSRNF